MAAYSWEDDYEAAIRETDHVKRLDRIAAAKASIAVRIAELEGKDSPKDQDEKNAIADAIRGLNILRKRD